MEWSGNMMYQPPYEHRPSYRSRHDGTGGVQAGGIVVPGPGVPLHDGPSSTTYPDKYAFEVAQPAGVWPGTEEWTRGEHPPQEPSLDNHPQHYTSQGPDGGVWQPQGRGGEAWQPQGRGGEAWQPQGRGGEAWQPQGPNEKAWQLQGSDGEIWQLQGPNGEPWQPQGPDGETWQLQGPNGEAWQPQDPVGEEWQPQDPVGEVWQLQGPNGVAWQLQGPNGETWQPQGPVGEAWQPQGLNGEVWQSQGPNGEAWQPQGPVGEVWQPRGWPEDHRGAPEGSQEVLGRRNHPLPEGDAPSRGQSQNFKDIIITADVNLPRLTVASSSPYANRPKKSGHGLPNLGNTCYMNAVLQCLYHTRDLTEYFCRGISWADINEKSTTKGEVALAYAEVVKALESGKEKGAALRNLQRVCGDYDERFQGHDQKEAHDLLGSLLHWLHQDLATGDLVCACAKKASSRKHQQVRWQTQEPSDSRVLPRQGLHRSNDNPHSRPPRPSERHPERRPGATNVPADARRGAEAPRTSEETTDVREPPPRRCRGCGVQMEAGSIISDLFVGIHESTIICLTSGTILCRTHERYTSLTLAVNLMGETDLVDALKHYYRSQDILRQCVYCEREHLCQRETRILSLPRVLLLHLTRDSPDLQERRVSRVSFPDEGLGLDDHLATELVPRGRRYSLSSVCNRHGSMTRAHYTAYCRSRRQQRLLPQSWYLFDDDHVEPARSFRAPYEAHILFYECLND